MNKRRLGDSELLVSPIGLGCWQFSKGKGGVGGYWAALSEEREAEVVRAAIGGGINWFDTAEIYGRGRSERALSTALRRASVAAGGVIIATKWFPVPRFAGSITKTIHERTSALDPFPIDLYQIHFPASFSSIPTQMNRMADLVAERKIRYVGVSNFSAEQLRAAHKSLADRGIPLISNQVRYSLLDRRIERNGVLEAARELGVSIIAYSPLAQGILTGRFHEDPEQVRHMKGMRKRQRGYRPAALRKTRPLVETLREVGRAHEVSAAEVALNWLVSFHGQIVVAIPGASRTEQAAHNARAMSFELSAQEMERIDRASQSVS